MIHSSVGKMYKEGKPGDTSQYFFFDGGISDPVEYTVWRCMKAFAEGMNWSFGSMTKAQYKRALRHAVDELKVPEEPDMVDLILEGKDG